MLDSTTYHVYNVLIPQTDCVAIQCIETLRAHCIQHNDGYLIVGGDFNCTINPCLDRFRTSFERRIKVAQALQNLMSELNVSDVWRRQNPTKCEYTWLRNSPCKDSSMSMARLDRIYLPNDILPSVMSCKINPCAISDHSAVTVNWKTSSSPRRGSPYWHFNNSLLENKEYTDTIAIFWRQWQSQK